MTHYTRYHLEQTLRYLTAAYSPQQVQAMPTAVLLFRVQDLLLQQGCVPFTEEELIAALEEEE